MSSSDISPDTSPTPLTYVSLPFGLAMLLPGVTTVVGAAGCRAAGAEGRGVALVLLHVHVVFVLAEAMPLEGGSAVVRPTKASAASSRDSASCAIRSSTAVLSTSRPLGAALTVPVRAGDGILGTEG